MSHCKICKTDVRKLVRCHIYPQSMTKELAGDDGPLLSMSNRFGPRMGVAHAGIFDDDLACLACERLFGVGDDYAIKFRRHALNLTIPFKIQRLCPSQALPTVAMPTFSANPSRLHTFAMHTLFRAHLSSRWEHDQINEAFIENEVRASLASGAATIEQGRQVCIIITRGEIGGYLTAPHFLPHPEFPKYVLQMPNMTIYIDAGSRGLGPGFELLALRPGTEVSVWRRRNPVPAELRWPAELIAELGNRPDRFFGRSGRRQK